MFGAAALFVFLVLAAQYESWKLPLAVVLIVPMCLLASVTGLLLRGMPIDVLAQIGFVVLVGLAAKNAILIVEFARQTEEAGATPGEAAVSAARTRLRPILMTSLAFIFGVAPLVVATGAGSEMRQSLGTAVFAGMLGVTGFGLLVHAGVLHGRPQDRAQKAESKTQRSRARELYRCQSRRPCERRARAEPGDLRRVNGTADFVKSALQNKEPSSPVNCWVLCVVLVAGRRNHAREASGN